MAEQAIWWTGAAILAAVGALGAAAIFAGLVSLTVHLVSKHVLKTWFMGKNLAALGRYVSAGQPEWQRGKDGVYRMAPTAGPWSDEPAEDAPIPHTPA